MEEQQQLREEILATLWNKISMLNYCVNTSCKKLYQCNFTLPSGYYNIMTPQEVERVYCEMNATISVATSLEDG